LTRAGGIDHDKRRVSIVGDSPYYAVEIIYFDNESDDMLSEFQGLVAKL
jgi:hypothetical protein